MPEVPPDSTPPCADTRLAAAPQPVPAIKTAKGARLQAAVHSYRADAATAQAAYVMTPRKTRATNRSADSSPGQNAAESRRKPAAENGQERPTGCRRPSTIQRPCPPLPSAAESSSRLLAYSRNPFAQPPARQVQQRT